MKIKTCEATPLQLNYLVAVCEGWKRELCYLNTEYPAYGSNWSLAGPIIERGGIAVLPCPRGWSARIGFGGEYIEGPTPLIAAMRCYVASELGDEVEIPEELT